MDSLFKEYTNLKNKETKLKLVIGLLSLLLLGVIAVFSSSLAVEESKIHQKEAEIKQLSALESKVKKIQGEKEAASLEARALLDEGVGIVNDFIHILQMQDTLIIKLVQQANPSYWFKTEPSQINSERAQIRSQISQIDSERRKLNGKLEKWYGKLNNF
jgi:hypothetical protein